MFRTLVGLVCLAGTASAHVGSPDVFYEGSAGPYKLFVTIRPPVVIPGIAEIEIRSSSDDVRELRITPIPLTGLGAKLAPAPDIAKRSEHDPQFYTGTLWLMRAGAWQVRIQADGARGPGETSVPVPALPSRTLGMQPGMGAILAALMLVLCVGAVSIIGAGAREGGLDPGRLPGPFERRRARITMSATAVLVIVVLCLGNNWWKAEAGAYSRYVYRPLEMQPALEPPGRLVLRLRNPGWLGPNALDDFLPDHGHLMHLFMVRLPEMERVWHLHPDFVESGVFAHELPQMPAGKHQIYADVVHKSGVPETLVGEIELPDIAGKPLFGDDSAGVGPGLSQTRKDPHSAALEGGGRMVWEPGPTPLKAKQPYIHRFRIEDIAGRPAQDLELYMGMQGHAAFIKTDRSAFAHIHPSGSVPMAMMNLTTSPSAEPHTGHAASHQLPPVVAFPYGFPTPGDYRIVVQVKRAGKVETGVFDARVE